jgi:cell division septation protein DedD
MKDDDDDTPRGFDDFVDSDDDDSRDLSDRDSDLPMARDGIGRAPDPGFAAFRDDDEDFEDLVAAWPDDEQPLSALADDLAASLADDNDYRSRDPLGSHRDAAVTAPLPEDNTALPPEAVQAFADEFPDDEVDDNRSAPASVDRDDEPVIQASPFSGQPGLTGQAGDSALDSPAHYADEPARIDDSVIATLLDDTDGPESGGADAFEQPADAVPMPTSTRPAIDPHDDLMAAAAPARRHDPEPVDDAVIDALAAEAFAREDATRSVDALADDLAADGDLQRFDPPPETEDARPREPTAIHDDLIDDFLSDIDDDLDEELPPLPAMAEPVSGAPGVSAAPPADPVPPWSGTSEPSDTDDILMGDSRLSDRSSTDSDDTAGAGRKVPWGMLGSLLLALALLLFGGYGVLEQRSSLQQEIRELQAALSTAVSPEQARNYRERQAQLELGNEKLTEEVKRLEAANAAVSAQLEEANAALADSRSELEAVRADAAKALADARAVSEQTAKAAGRSTTAATNSTGSSSPAKASAAGPWFVNFGSYTARSIAASWSTRLDVSDGNVVIQETVSNGRNLYRLRVVGLTDRDSAERVAGELERRFDLPRLWVGRD